MTDEPSITLTKSELHSVVKDTVNETLSGLGIDYTKPQEFQRDMQHLRDWRVASQTVKRHALLTAMGIFITGALAAVWVGFSELLQR